MICKYCKGRCKKDGLQNNGTQRYRCKKCHRRQQRKYSYRAYNPEVNHSIVTLTKNGVGIRSTARILGISNTTLLKRILHIAKNIQQPAISKGQIYEVDEMRTFEKHKSKLIWIVYALNRKTKKVASYNIGSRTNKTLNVVIRTYIFPKRNGYIPTG